MLRLSLFLVYLLVLSSSTWAANDWSKPCLQGVCSYDIPQTDSNMGGALLITGASHAISDITSAGGWDVLNCSSDSITQTIRIVCTGDDANCDHLHENGAEDTLVRLPENCGKGPFARVSKMIMSDDQSVPPAIASKLAKREGGPAKVMTLGLDTNFTSSAHGPVSFKIVGSSIPNALSNVKMTPARKRKVDKRGNSEEMDDMLQTFNDLSLGDFDKNISTTLPPINVDKNFTVFTQNISCSQVVNAGFDVAVDAKVDAQVTLGVVAQGSLVPPAVTEFAMFAALSADLSGSLDIGANVAGSIDTGSIPLLSTGLPGLDIAGIFSIGPTLNLNAEAKATVDVDVDLQVDLAYQVSNLKFVFPPEQGDSVIDVSPKDSPLQLSVSPNVTTNTTIEAHLIPSLNFGISLVDVVDASIFLNLDASATLNLGLDAEASAKISTNGDKSASADIEGCVDLEGAFSANVGAEGSFFDIFNEDTSIPLISKQFQLFQKCFSDSTSTDGDSSMKGAMAAISTSAMKYSTLSSALADSTSIYTASSDQASKELSTTSLNEAKSRTPRPSATAVYSVPSVSTSVQGTPSSTDALYSRSLSTEKRTTVGSYQRRKTRTLKDRAALTCTSSNVGIAQLLVDELLNSASFKVL